MKYFKKKERKGKNYGGATRSWRVISTQCVVTMSGAEVDGDESHDTEMSWRE